MMSQATKKEKLVLWENRIREFTRKNKNLLWVREAYIESIRVTVMQNTQTQHSARYNLVKLDTNRTSEGRRFGYTHLIPVLTPSLSHSSRRITPRPASLPLYHHFWVVWATPQREAPFRQPPASPEQGVFCEVPLLLVANNKCSLQFSSSWWDMVTVSCIRVPRE
jgi:hypothetical protein